MDTGCECSSDFCMESFVDNTALFFFWYSLFPVHLIWMLISNFSGGFRDVSKVLHLKTHVIKHIRLWRTKPMQLLITLRFVVHWLSLLVQLLAGPPDSWNYSITLWGLFVWLDMMLQIGLYPRGHIFGVGLKFYGPDKHSSDMWSHKVCSIQ